MIDLYLLSVLAFFSILAIIIYRDRKNIDFKYIVFMRRTKRFRDVLDRIANKSIGFWKVVGTIGFIVCIVVMAYGTYNLISASYLVSIGFSRPTIQIALPMPSSQIFVSQWVIGIPFWFWLIAVAIILIPHEMFHGIMARAEKIKLKDVGIMLLAMFPGAFVEPDEKQLKKSKLMTKLRIFSSGSFINIVIGFSVLLLVQTLLWAPNVNGLLITSVNQTSPAGQAGLKPGMVLEYINGEPLEISFAQYSFLILTMSGSNSEDVVSYLSQYALLPNLAQYKPKEKVTLTVDGNNYEVTLDENPNAKKFPYIGIGSKLNADTSMFQVTFPLLGIIASLSILVGAFNILPIFPLDGGLIIKSIGDKYFKKMSNRVTMIITFFMVAIIMFLIIVPLLYHASIL